MHLSRTESIQISEDYFKRVGINETFEEVKAILKNCNGLREKLNFTPPTPTPTPNTESSSPPKALFILGSAGSGKSYIIEHLLPPLKTPMYLYNPDQYVELLMDMFYVAQTKNDDSLKESIARVNPETRTNPSLMESYKNAWTSSMIQWFLGQAKECSFADFNRMVDARASILIDRPGDSLLPKSRSGRSNVFDKNNSVLQQMKHLSKHGYAIYIVMNYADLPTCLERNHRRRRSLPPRVVATIWQGVYSLIDDYKSYATKNKWHWMIYDNRPPHPPPMSSLRKYFDDDQVADYKDLLKTTGLDSPPKGMMNAEAARSLLTQWLSA